MALIHYKGNRTQQELFEIASIHKEGFDKFYSSTHQESSTKNQRLDYSRVTKSITDIFAADPANITDNGSSSTKTPKRILIEGAPGIGKTVLAKEIAYQWTTNEILTKTKIVFLIYLRDPHLQSLATTKELVEYMSDECLSSEQIATLTTYLANTEGQELCIVMDGFDEYPTSLQKDSFIVNVINGRVFSEATVVITSRPTATVSLHDRVDRRIDILGLPKEERDKYISEVFSNLPNKKVELDKYLKQQPVINGLCFVPLHLAILLYLFQQGSLPETLTEMNESFILHTIYRHLERYGITPCGAVDNLTKVPKPILTIVDKLSELAFKGLQENKLVFTFEEIKQICPCIDQTVGAINGFGLLQAVEHYPHKGAGTTKSFNFLHFTMQEFLAALHVSTLPSEQQSSLMERKFWDGHYQFMWMMFVGIIGVKSDVFVNFISKGKVYKGKCEIRIADPIRNNKNKCLHLFQCYLEAKESTEIPEVISSMFKDGKVTFSNVKLLPHKITSLMSFICTKQSMQWKSLVLYQCKIGDTGMSVLQQFISDTTSTLEYVDLTHNHSSPWGVYCAIIRHCSVNSLTLCGDDGIGQYVNELKEVLQMNTTLISLKLSNITINGAINIAKAIQMNTTLQALDMSNNKISDDGVIAISDYLKRNSSLEKIDLSTNKVTSEGAKVVAEVIQVNTTLEKLDLPFNKLSDEGASFISDGLKTNKSLQELKLSKNKITKEGTKMIAEALQLNTTLKQLDLSINKIFDDGVTAISNVLKSNNTLQELNISHNNITNKGIRKITEAIQINSTLQNINISKNHITTEGLLNFMEAVKNNCTLQVINITHNYVTRSGFTNIKQCIENLQHPIIIYASWNEIIDKNGKIVSKITSSCAPDNIKEDKWWFTEYDPDYLIMFLSEYLKEDDILQELNLCFKRITSEGAKLIAQAMKLNKTLKKLNISHNTIFDDGAAAISDSLKSNTSLQELDIRGNKITSEGAKLIAEAIKVNKTLKKFDIFYNAISDDGAAAISDSLQSNNSLQELSMGNNKITSEGAKKVAEAIKVNKTLKKFDIFNNAISDDGAAAISDSLQSNNSLQELSMGNNKITSEGAKKVAEAIKVNKTLKKLEIFENTISDDGAAAISDSLKSNSSLQELYMSYNNITSEGAKKIAEAIQVNTTLHTLDIRQHNINDALSFNMTVLTAVYHNNTLMTLRLLSVSDNDYILVRSEVKKINKERIRQGISTLTCHYYHW